MLRKLLTTTALICLAGGTALAADLPSEKGPPVYAPPPPPAFSWSGVYLGGQVGYGWGTTHFVDNTAGVGLNGLSQSGVVGGAHIGYNYQVSQFVFGLEGDVNGSSERDSTFDPFAGGYSLRENIDASIRGRVGYAFDRVLIYATGGGAYGNFHTSYNGVDAFNTGRIGWTVGGGLEYAIDNNWSVRAEYRYTDYGHTTDFPSSEGFDAVSHHIRDNRVQAGFSYKFDIFSPPAPIVSKY
ncbi:MAG: outer membrane protein [Methylovirgula sp.]|uniref:outer membrane protein n=1 Tax=Methylovirgula sp. TaxID=1978224 RepID=UPI0030764F14